MLLSCFCTTTWLSAEKTLDGKWELNHLITLILWQKPKVSSKDWSNKENIVPITREQNELQCWVESQSLEFTSDYLIQKTLNCGHRIVRYMFVLLNILRLEKLLNVSHSNFNCITAITVVNSIALSPVGVYVWEGWLKGIITMESNAVIAKHVAINWCHVNGMKYKLQLIIYDALVQG